MRKSNGFNGFRVLHWIVCPSKLDPPFLLGIRDRHINPKWNLTDAGSWPNQCDTCLKIKIYEHATTNSGTCTDVVLASLRVYGVVLFFFTENIL